MKTIFLTILFLSLSVEAKIKIKLVFSPVSNFIYQIDCISNSLDQCSKEAYQDLWAKRFFQTSEDLSVVKSWGELMKKYQKEISFQEDRKKLITGRFEGVKLATKIRIASFQSTDITDYLSRLDLVVMPRDRREFERILRHFYPRFEKWWNEIAYKKGSSFARKTDTLLNNSEVRQKIDQFFQFYEVILPEDYTVNFNLFYQPNPRIGTSGQQIENYSVAEFLTDEKPEDRIDIIIHELCHFFFENSTDEKFLKMQSIFEKKERMEVRGAYNLLNETLATSLGNGLINKMVMDKAKWERYSNKPLSFYNDYYIDKAAKSILPWLQTWIAENKTIYDSEFVNKYVSLLEHAFGGELTSPKLLLNEMIFVVDSKFEEHLIEALRNSLRPSSLFKSIGTWSDERTLQSYKEQSSVGALIVVHSSNVNQLKEKRVLNQNDFNFLMRSLKKKRLGVFSFVRSPNVPAYILVARDHEEAIRLLEKLAEMKEGFSGELPL